MTTDVFDGNDDADGDDLFFPELARAAKRLGLDAGELAESLLVRLDAGEGYWSALHGVVAEAAERRGKYCGETKRQIDGGDIFFAAPRRNPVEASRRWLVHSQCCSLG